MSTEEKGKISPRKKLKGVEERYTEARQQITSAILSESPPTEDVDISFGYRQSRSLLGDYVTLDWQHRQDILRIITQIVGRQGMSQFMDSKTNQQSRD